MATDSWYKLNQPGQTDSPALLVYPARIKHNINEMIRIAGSPERLVPHVKTHKISAIVKMQLKAGITRFKCATIAEAEMLGQAGAKEVLIAYQLHGPKIIRLLQLVKNYPKVNYASLVDNTDSVSELNNLFAKQGLTAAVYVDIDNGMHRTGFSAKGDIVSFYKKINSFPNIHCKGLHVYDGHIHETDFAKRKSKCVTAFKPVRQAASSIEESGLPKPDVIAGGSPTFPIHALNPDVSCSPGTSLLWDKGYAGSFPDLPFLPAAVLLTRIISKPVTGKITIDLGYKSVASENTIEKRISFLTLNNYKVGKQSEEHWEVKVTGKEWKDLRIGDALYGIPYHICPTVALYDKVIVVEDGVVKGKWTVEARDRQLVI